jgi:leucyl-tRNA synthetase
VDWCPNCNTTLAREQVWGEDRHCERCGTPVIKKNLEQWKFRITNYADELLDGLDTIDWPERVKVMQTNWIGRSIGAEVVFKTEGGDPLEIFTTRPDTLWGATFMVLAPEHPLVDAITTADRRAEVGAYKAEAARMDEIARSAKDKEKTGVFTGGYAVNPVNGERIPIWIADYVMMGYGTGAIMAVPAHDGRDFEFAKKYGLEIRRVITGPDGAQGPMDEAYDSKQDGELINSGPFDATPVGGAVAKVTEWLEANGLGRGAVNYRMRDWLISRQRMWGSPIPIIYCDNCGVVPVPYEDLPVLLPDDAEFRPTGESPLKYHEGFRYVKCPECGGDAERETDTLDTFMCSSWYQYAYISPYWKAGQPLKVDDMPWDKEAGQYWLPVDQYTGGIEHATMHLLYTRFFTKALRDLGIVNFDEPMLRLFNQGMILGPDGEKMSKSRGNVINPDEFVGKYGADTVRGYLMFIGPWDMGGPWDMNAIEGVYRFLHRAWNLVVDDPQMANPTLDPSVQPDPEAVRSLERKLHQTIGKVGDDMANFRFNTAIASLMELNNTLIKAKETAVVNSGAWNQAIRSLILMMAPIFPHIAEELWHRQGNTSSVHLQRWPEADREKARVDEVTVVVQINGKVRDKLMAAPGTEKADLESAALALESVRKWLEGKEVQRAIVVPDKLVNIVVK